MKNHSEIDSKVSKYQSDDYLEKLLDTVTIGSLDSPVKIKDAHELIMQLGGYDNIFKKLGKTEYVIKNYKQAIMNRLQFIL